MRGEVRRRRSRGEGRGGGREMKRRTIGAVKRCIRTSCSLTVIMIQAGFGKSILCTQLLLFILYLLYVSPVLVYTPSLTHFSFPPPRRTSPLPPICSQAGSDKPPAIRAFLLAVTQHLRAPWICLVTSIAPDSMFSGSSECTIPTSSMAVPLGPSSCVTVFIAFLLFTASC